MTAQPLSFIPCRGVPAANSAEIEAEIPALDFSGTDSGNMTAFSVHEFRKVKSFSSYISVRYVYFLCYYRDYYAVLFLSCYTEMRIVIIISVIITIKLQSISGTNAKESLRLGILVSQGYSQITRYSYPNNKLSSKYSRGYSKVLFSYANARHGPIYLFLRHNY